MTTTDRIPNGTLVKLPDGTYRTSQTNRGTYGLRIDEGWRREQLTVV